MKVTARLDLAWNAPYTYKVSFIFDLQIGRTIGYTKHEHSNYWLLKLTFLDLEFYLYSTMTGDVR